MRLRANIQAQEHLILTKLIECGSNTDRGIELYLTSVNPDNKEFGETKLDRSAFSVLCKALNMSKGFGKYRNNLTADEISQVIQNSSLEELLKTGETAVNNLVNYGAPTWYEWSLMNWGTKWNSYSNSFNENILGFQTAWAAPHPILEKFSEMYPDITMVHKWADEDIGSNCGMRAYLGGEINDEFFPTDGKEAVEYACEVWGYDAKEDLGLCLNAAGTDYICIENSNYELITIFDKPALFANERLSKSSIPEGLYVYHLRESDDGSRFASIEGKVTVNHGGSVVITQPIDLGENGYVEFTSETEPNFLGKSLTFGEYMRGETEQMETEAMSLC